LIDPSLLIEIEADARRAKQDLPTEPAADPQATA
jgi:hypothetical protein